MVRCCQCILNDTIIIRRLEKYVKHVNYIAIKIIKHLGGINHGINKNYYSANYY